MGGRTLSAYLHRAYIINYFLNDTYLILTNVNCYWFKINKKRPPEGSRRYIEGNDIMQSA